MVLLVAVAAAVFAVDRLTKFLVQQHLDLNSPQPLLDGLVYLNRTQNSGAAFSFGRSLGNFYLVFALIAAVVIVYAYRRVPPEEIWTRVGLGMVLGGALGNALDRLLTSSVTDFIDLRWWPVFNLADSCIVVGALILVWRLQRRGRSRAE
jgi:signal peptidase II